MEWRKFYRLLGTMPLDSSLFFAPYYKAYAEGNLDDLSDEPPKDWWKKELDKRRGRSHRTRQATSIDQMLLDQKAIGRDNGS